MMQTEHIIILTMVSVTLLTVIAAVVLSNISLSTQIDVENNEKEKGSKQCNPVSNAASDNLSIFKIFLVRYCSFDSEQQLD